jgi:hypothetical protein
MHEQQRLVTDARRVEHAIGPHDPLRDDGFAQHRVLRDGEAMSLG